MTWEEWWIVMGVGATLLAFFVGFEILFPAQKEEKTDSAVHYPQARPGTNRAA
jgi:hypothetical protein